MTSLPVLHITLPPWVEQVVPWDTTFPTDESRMALAVLLSRANIEHRTGGPFGAAVFEAATGRLVAVGVNSVERHTNSVLHAEMVALMMAQHRVQRFTLDAAGQPAHELVTSCDPCAMCFGSLLWSGVHRVVCGATREDAMRLGFDEGPVFEASYRYLEERGVRFVREVQRDAAAAVLEAYRSGGGPVYNG